MAIAQTGAIYKSLEFDGGSSRTYGVYITGEAVYSAPEREVEMIAIPGRDGTFALDRGRFENITVTYPAGIFADTETDFAEAISDFRNFLCSRSGYCRLTDEYNPDEYRLAVYKSGLEVEPALLRAGKFDIVFECMPQRFLTSGETVVAVANNGTLTNPTRFKSKPLLEIKGYGKFALNGEQLEITGGPIGNYVAFSSGSASTLTYSVVFDDTFALAGDAIKITNCGCAFMLALDSGEISTTAADSITQNGIKATISGNSSEDYILGGTTMNNKSFIYGTAETKAVSLSVSFATSDFGTITVSLSGSVAYDGVKTITITTTITAANTTVSYKNTSCGNVIINSSASTLGNPLYFDLDIGEAYKIENGSFVSVNAGVTIPAELPALVPGSNTITFDNTITSFKITPRWWKV